MIRFYNKQEYMKGKLEHWSTVPSAVQNIFNTRSSVFPSLILCKHNKLSLYLVKINLKGFSSMHYWPISVTEGEPSNSWA